MNEIIRNGCLLFGLTLLTACQSDRPSDGLVLSTSAKPVTLVASIGKTIQKCWFKSKNPTFLRFRLANEVNSLSGRPRLLLVPKNKPTGLPLLVVQAEKTGGRTQLQAFGPLLSTDAGKAISTDLRNWTAGQTSCAS